MPIIGRVKVNKKLNNSNKTAKAKFKYRKKAKVRSHTSGNIYTRYWYGKAKTARS